MIHVQSHLLRFLTLVTTTLIHLHEVTRITTLHQHHILTALIRNVKVKFVLIVIEITNLVR